MNTVRFLLILCLISVTATSQDGGARPRYEEMRDEAWRGPQGDSSAEIPLAGSLSLAQVLGEAERNHPSIESALNAWRAAIAEFPQAASLDDPTLTYAVAPFTLERPSTPNGELVRGQRIEVSQRFPWPGKRRLRGEIALHEADSVRGDLDEVRESLRYAAKLAYYEYWFVFRALHVNSVNQELLDELHAVAESRYRAGLVSLQDTLQAEVETEHLNHRDIVLARMRNVASVRIATLMGHGSDYSPPPPPDALSPPGQLPEISALRAFALAHRPELQAIAARKRSGDASLELARKDFYPDFTAFVGYNSLWQEDDLRPIVGVSVNIPVRLSRRRGAVEQASVDTQRLRAETARRALDIEFEVTEAYERVAESHHVVSLYEGRLIPSAEANLEAARAGYASGEVDFMALLTAQKLLMDTRLKRYEALADIHRNTAALERAIAGELADATRWE